MDWQTDWLHSHPQGNLAESTSQLQPVNPGASSKPFFRRKE